MRDVTLFFPSFELDCDFHVYFRLEYNLKVLHFNCLMANIRYLFATIAALNFIQIDRQIKLRWLITEKGRLHLRAQQK